MKLTVVLCTFNRCQSLNRALESLAASDLPPDTAWEILVVDNNSTDKTRDVAESFCSKYPSHFRYVFEPTPGKSNALNRGIWEARGDVLAFTDDDVIVEPIWLWNLTAHLDGKEWAGAAGPVRPQRNLELPSWVPCNERYGLSPLTLFDPGLDAGPLFESPFGANMAYQKRVFDLYGGFRTDLGPGIGGNTPQKSEDSEFGRRVLAAGEHIRYEPSATVYHAQSPGRLQRSYFLHWWFDKARADIRVMSPASGRQRRICGVPLIYFARLAAWSMRWMLHMNPAERFSCKINVWRLAGSIVESYHRTKTTESAKSQPVSGKMRCSELKNG